jgi:ligand-binding sensor domain-containing protein
MAMRINITANLLLLTLMLYSLQVAGYTIEDTQLGWFNEKRVRSLSQFQGLSSAKITCLLKDRKGYVWIGTNNGLNRYDGTSITLFSYNPENSNSIGSDAIAALYEDKNGLLWVGTKDGLYTFNYKDQSFTRQIIDPNKKDHITSMTEDKDGTLWIGNIYGLIKYNQENKTYQLADFSDIENGEKNNFAFKLLTDKQGELWIGTWNYGIYRMNPLTGAYKKFNVPGFDESHTFTGRVTSLEEGPDGSIWFGCWGYGISTTWTIPTH